MVSQAKYAVNVKPMKLHTFTLILFLLRDSGSSSLKTSTQDVLSIGMWLLENGRDIKRCTLKIKNI